jgi:hypothetical protein
LYSQEAFEVGCGYLRDLFDCEATEFGDAAGNLYYVRRFVTVSAMRHGRQKRAISFDQQIFERDLLRDLPQVFGFAKRHNTGERDQEIEFERLLCEFFAAGETMKDAATLGSGVFSSQYFDRLGFGFARVNDDRDIARARGAKLASEGVHLHIAR